MIKTFETFREIDPYGEEEWEDGLRYKIKQYLDDSNFFYKELGRDGDVYHIQHKKFHFVIYQDKDDGKFYINSSYDSGYDRSKRYEITSIYSIQFYMDSVVRINSPFKEGVKWYSGGKLNKDSEWEKKMNQNHYYTQLNGTHIIFIIMFLRKLK